MNMRVKIGDQIFEVEVGDLNARPVLAKVDCDTFEVWPEEEVVEEVVVRPTAPAAPRPTPVAPAPVARSAVPAPANGGGDKSRMVTAPIPGTIISVAVKPGDKIETGQELCILEAMKMKNAIRATRAGVIAAIHIAVGDKVRHGQPLVEFTD